MFPFLESSYEEDWEGGLVTLKEPSQVREGCETYNAVNEYIWASSTQFFINGQTLLNINIYIFLYFLGKKA